MAISDHFGAGDAETPMLESAVVNGAVDYKGRQASRLNSGRWRSAGFIIGVEIAERFTYYGIRANLIMYLTGPLGQSIAAAAANINMWSGTAALLPLLGGFIADSFLGRYRTIAILGRYRTIAISSLVYILGLGLLTLSAFLPYLSGFDCQSNRIMPCSPSPFQVILFFFSLYLVAVGQGGHRPCTQAFGADQFDGEDSEECKAKSSFFNWWFFGLCAGVLVTCSVVSYIQENFSWGLGFGIPCIAMVIALVVFLLGSRTYRYSVAQNAKGPFTRIGNVFVAAFKKRQRNPTIITTQAESRAFLPHKSSEQFKFLNRALIAPDHLEEEGWLCSIAEVEEAKAVLRLFPIWCSCLVYGIVIEQHVTFFIKQGATMDRMIISGFNIPSASFQSISTVFVLIFLPIYDRILVPIARSFTGNSSGITMLQRIGTGIFISIIIMILVALVEIKRLKTIHEYDLVDNPSATIPMSIWWMLPHNILFGVADVFTMVGMQEFFYDQVPTELRSIGLALFISIAGVGSFLSAFLVSIIDRATSGSDKDSWISNNLNKAHLDYYYWLLTGLSALGFACYLHFAKSYIYKRKM